VPTPATVTLLTRPGCHLCDAAREIVTTVVGETAHVTLTELSIADSAELADRYAEEIPVVLINDRVHNIWRIDPDRLRAALLEATE
jgi:glutaredoxin